MKNCPTCKKDFIKKTKESWKQFYKKIYCSKKCMGMGKRREKHPGWKNGKSKHSQGYIMIHYPNHPYAKSNGYVFEHRLIMEQYLERYLSKDELVHHINEIKTDNRIENLKIMNRREHFIYHHK